MVVEAMIVAQLATATGVIVNNRRHQDLVVQVNKNTKNIKQLDINVKAINGATVTNQEAILYIIKKGK